MRARRLKVGAIGKTCDDDLYVFPDGGSMESIEYEGFLRLTEGFEKLNYDLERVCGKTFDEALKSFGIKRPYHSNVIMW